MQIQLKRREFVTLLGGAAAGWPVVAQAQQPAMPVIGLLHSTSPDALTDILRAFRQGLKDTGYVEGENVAIEYRFAENQIERLPEMAADLLRRQVAVIVTPGSGVSAAKAATATTPIVFVAGEDPVRLGLVASLARPGGNLTGVNIFASELVAKRLELLRELVPGVARVALLVNPANPAIAESAFRDVQAAARAIGLQIQVLNATTSREIDAAFATLARERPDALFVSADPLFTNRRVQLILLATRHAFPATYGGRQFPDVGGLMSYGAYRAAIEFEAGQRPDPSGKNPSVATLYAVAKYVRPRLVNKRASQKTAEATVREWRRLPRYRANVVLQRPGALRVKT